MAEPSIALMAAKLIFFAGDIPLALQYVERAIQMDRACAQYAASAPVYARYRVDPRFSALLAKYAAHSN